MSENNYESLVRIVRARQDAKHGPPEIRYLARRLHIKQCDVLQLCEDLDLNVNIGIQCGNGIGEFDRIGDYTVEDLTVDVQNGGNHE